MKIQMFVLICFEDYFLGKYDKTFFLKKMALQIPSVFIEEVRCFTAHLIKFQFNR